jgi:LysR family transcriptional regulator, hypochlorite-specific transcription factor HypT
MDTRWFQDFLTLAEVGNFTKASELRNLSQAAFSRRIQALEQWLGAKLIDRNTFPTVLTEAGVRFRVVATEVVGKLAEARAEIGATPARNHVRIALPYALATTRLPDWWKTWSDGQSLSCSLELGNVHDTVSALTTGAVDLLICYQHEEQPIRIGESRFEKVTLDTEIVRPYAARAEVESGRVALPGNESHPMPLLMYSPTVYFARVVEIACDRAPEKIFGYRVFEAEMSDVLGDLASSGLGVAWLPDSSFRPNRDWNLVPLGDGKWDMTVSIDAYRAKGSQRPGVEELWREIQHGAR